jgi:hypothetical protein
LREPTGKFGSTLRSAPEVTDLKSLADLLLETARIQ